MFFQSPLPYVLKWHSPLSSIPKLIFLRDIFSQISSIQNTLTLCPFKVTLSSYIYIIIFLEYFMRKWILNVLLLSWKSCVLLKPAEKTFVVAIPREGCMIVLRIQSDPPNPPLLDPPKWWSGRKWLETNHHLGGSRRGGLGGSDCIVLYNRKCLCAGNVCEFCVYRESHENFLHANITIDFF